MKRVLHIVGRMDRGGAETMLMNLYLALDKEKFQFDFLYFTNDKCDFDNEIEQLGGQIYRLPETQYGNPISRMFGLKKMLAENKHIQIIHCHTLFSNGFHLWAGKFAGVKVRIAHSHNTSDKKGNNFRRKVYHKVAKNLIKQSATHYVACGEQARDYLFSGKKNVLLINNAVDTNNLNRLGEQSKNYLRDRFNIEKNTLVLVQIGSLCKTKNQEFSIHLSEMLISKNIKHILFLVGVGTDFERLSELIENNRQNKYIKLLGLRKDVPNILGGSDLMLMPSLHEGFPVVLVESQSVGIPALISDTISKEVDLGVGLIEMMSLKSSVDKWANTVVEQTAKNRMNATKRLEILKQKGFDIHGSVQVLTKLYSSCLDD